MSQSSGWGGGGPRQRQSPDYVQANVCKELADLSPNFKKEYEKLPANSRYDEVRGAISAAAEKAREQEGQAAKAEDAVDFGSEAAGLERLKDTLSPTDLKRRFDDPATQKIFRGAVG